MHIEIQTPARDDIGGAVAMLLGRNSPADLDLQVESLLASVKRSEISLDGLLAAYVGDELIGVTLAVCQSDGTAHVWPPSMTRDAPHEAALALALACRNWIETSAATFAQCLTSVDDIAAHTLLEQAGYERLTDLVCWQHDFAEIPHAPWPEDCDIVLYSEAERSHFERVIELTYAESQDCLGLKGRRTARESLAAHRLAADAESRLWQVYQYADEDVGVVLCADHRDQRMWELLYLGVMPKFRRQGFGLAMLCEVLWNAREAGAEAVFLAADDANDAAANLYEACGFTVGFRQRIHVWFPERRMKI